jgi:CheY-like chemotaxis protein
MLVTSPSLLITDDDSAFRETVRDLLEPRGFHTVLARDGEEAIHIVQTRPIHLALLDMHMPRMDGLETLRLVKQYKAMLPCIVVSGGLDERLRAQLDEVQPFCVLAKPVSAEQLTHTVEWALWQAYHWRR